MHYIYTDTTLPAIGKLSAILIDQLTAGKKVLWLLSGGSGGKVSLEAAKNLKGLDLKNLFVTLSDERYGPLGHANENWQILLDGGLELEGATLYRPLTGEDRDVTTEHFDTWLKDTLVGVNSVVGIFGVGPDGHTAGIKPHSSAIDSPALAASYTGEDFERITITPAFITHVDEAVVQIFGSEKHTVVEQLLNETIPITEQPAQALKYLSRVTLYTDYKEK